jgi:hypothetical protein
LGQGVVVEVLTPVAVKLVEVAVVVLFLMVFLMPTAYLLL